METPENIQQEKILPPQWPENPWISIWIQPRKTIQRIIQVDPERYVLILAALAGIGRALDQASSRAFGDQVSAGTLLISVVILGIIGGILSLYISGGVLSLVAGFFGGGASDREVRAAIAWSSVPLIASMFLWIPYFTLYGMEMFTSYTPTIENHPFGLLALSFIEIVISIWAFVVFLQCIRQVFDFSLWKAIAVTIIPGAALLVIFFGCSLLI